MTGTRRSANLTTAARPGRRFAALLALVAVFLNAFVVQTHLHTIAPFHAAAIERQADGADDTHATVTHEQAGCVICQALASGANAPLPDAALALLTARHAETAAVAEATNAPEPAAHFWRSRAPPLAV